MLFEAPEKRETRREQEAAERTAVATVDQTHSSRVLVLGGETKKEGRKEKPVRTRIIFGIAAVMEMLR